MDEKYQELIERHRHPRNRGRIEGAEKSFRSNFSCGDSIEFYIKVGREGVIEDAKFEGAGCALSTASADMVCDYVKGRKVEEICSLGVDDIAKMIGFMPSIGRVGCIKIISDAVQGLCNSSRPE